MQMNFGLLKEKKALPFLPKCIDKHWQNLAHAVSNVFNVSCRTRDLYAYLKSVTAQMLYLKFRKKPTVGSKFFQTAFECGPLNWTVPRGGRHVTRHVISLGYRLL